MQRIKGLPGSIGGRGISTGEGVSNIYGKLPMMARIRRRAIVLLGVALLGTAMTTPASAGSRAITVRGGFVNDITCVPAAADVEDSQIECWAGSTWDGGWTGHTILHIVATFDTMGRFAGRYEEWLIGTFAGDNSYGGLHTKGRFAIDEHNEFEARGKIVGGSCAFAGSKGTFSADGNSVHGGYVGKWVRKATAAEPGCVPDVPVPASRWRASHHPFQVR